MTKDKKVLILGNKPYDNFKFNDIIDSFDIIYRFNLAWPGKNNGTKFGKLAMCGHVYQNFVGNPISKERIIEIYKSEYDLAYLSDWYDFFQVNKGNFDEIFHQNEHNWGEWNRMLEKYGSPHKFSKMASTGYSTIFRTLSNDNNEVYISGFTLCDGEIRKTGGESAERTVQVNNNGGGCHLFSDEKKILAWLHNNKKIDASLCLLDDTDGFSIKTKNDNNSIKITQFIYDLINRK